MKIDTGFEWNYWKLSYRRKFIRTLWIVPYLVVVNLYIGYIDLPIANKAVIILVLVMIWAIQLIYNYKQYQKEKIK